MPGSVLDIYQLLGRKFAVVLTDFTGAGEPESYIVHGIAKILDGRLYVDRGTSVEFPIPEDTYSRIKAVPADLVSVFGDAAYFMTLSVGPKPDDGAEYMPTGVRLPPNKTRA